MQSMIDYQSMSYWEKHLNQGFTKVKEGEKDALVSSKVGVVGVKLP